MFYSSSILTKYAQSYQGFGGDAGSSTISIAANALRLAAKELGVNFTDEQMRILLGHASFESGFGMGGAKNSLRNTNNWGAIQATKSFMNSHTGEGFGAVAHKDSDPVHGSFIGWYAVNATAKDGAKQFIQQVINRIKNASSVEDYAARLYMAGYYGGGHAGQPGDPRPVGKRRPPFLPAETKNINDYALDIKKSMPSQLPPESEEDVKKATEMRSGEFAPITERFHVKTMDEAKQLWDKVGGSNAKAYGVKPISGFDQLVASNGAVSTTNSTQPQETSSSNEVAGLDNILNQYIQMLGVAASSETSLKKLYKKALPNNDILIEITAPNYTSAVEFSRILCTALDEDLISTTYPHTDGHRVEIECSISGSSKKCFAAVKQMAGAMEEAFKNATIKIGGIIVKTNCIMNKKSSYQAISSSTASTNYRKFMLKFV
jgi:hypothetical protein